MKITNSKKSFKEVNQFCIKKLRTELNIFTEDSIYARPYEYSKVSGTVTRIVVKYKPSHYFELWVCLSGELEIYKDNKLYPTQINILDLSSLNFSKYMN